MNSSLVSLCSMLFGPPCTWSIGRERVGTLDSQREMLKDPRPLYTVRHLGTDLYCLSKKLLKKLITYRYL